jgi:hypothetical protein
VLRLEHFRRLGEARDERAGEVKRHCGPHTVLGWEISQPEHTDRGGTDREHARRGGLTFERRHFAAAVAAGESGEMQARFGARIALPNPHFAVLDEKQRVIGLTLAEQRFAGSIVPGG